MALISKIPFPFFVSAFAEATPLLKDVVSVKMFKLSPTVPCVTSIVLAPVVLIWRAVVKVPLA